jgi:hypothetical protein
MRAVGAGFPTSPRFPHEPVQYPVDEWDRTQKKRNACFFEEMQESMR